MKILDEIWICISANPFMMAFLVKENISRITVGIIAKELEIGYWVAYIGVGLGRNEEEDRNSILGWGNKLSKDQAQGFFPNIDIKKYYGK